VEDAIRGQRIRIIVFVMPPGRSFACNGLIFQEFNPRSTPAGCTHHRHTKARNNARLGVMGPPHWSHSSSLEMVSRVFSSHASQTPSLFSSLRELLLALPHRGKFFAFLCLIYMGHKGLKAAFRQPGTASCLMSSADPHPLRRHDQCLSTIPSLATSLHSCVARHRV
jgi:hypothetical protein